MKWSIKDNVVLRGNRAIASISEMASGNWQWEGIGMRRQNFLMKEWILEDVKYFHRYPSKRKATFTLKSGKKVTF